MTASQLEAVTDEEVCVQDGELVDAAQAIENLRRRGKCPECGLKVRATVTAPGLLPRFLHEQKNPSCRRYQREVQRRRSHARSFCRHIVA
jgi:hypothetical protein